MAVDRDLVRRLADLASLELEEPEVARIAGDLESILTHVACLSELDDVEANLVSAGSAGPGRLRPDEPTPSLSREIALDQAPRASDGGFVVPRFVDGG